MSFRRAQHLRTPQAIILKALLWTVLWTAQGSAQAPCEALPESCPDRLDAETARGLALGLGLRATAISTAAVAYNPAGLILGRLYHVEASGDYLAGADTVAVGGAVADSSTSRLAGGLSLRGFISGDDGGYHGIDGRLALALPLSDRLSVGLTGRYVNVGTEVTDSESGGPQDVNLVKGFTIDGSLRFSLSEQVHAAALAYNMIDRKSPLLPVMAGGSVVFTPVETLALGVDSLVDFSSFGSPQPVLGLGAEFLAAQVFPLRGGYSFDKARKLHRVTLGLGYTERSLGIELSLRQDVAGGDATRLLAALRIYVE